MKSRKDNWIRRFDFFALAGWLGLSLGLAIISFVLYGMDFRGYYAAASVLVSGGNPYDYHQVAPVLLQITGEMGNNPYYYPPWFAWIFIPLTALPFQVARAVWMVFNLVVWNLGLWNLGKIFKWPPEGWKRYLLYSLATFSFAWITWRYEQAGILIFALLVAVIIAVENKQWTWAGFWMALLLIKPNVTLIVVAGLSLWLMRRHQWRPVFTMVLSLGILLAISTWVTPDWYKPLFEEGFGKGLTTVLDGPDKAVALRINTTLIDWLKTLGIAFGWQMPIYVIVAVAGIIILFTTIWRSESFLQVMSISLLVSYALTPYAMQYDNPSLIIVVFWALSICSSSLRGMRVAVLLAGFVFSVIFWQQNISWAYWIVVGSIALAAWAMLLDQKVVLKGAAP
ncbi:MAG: DUF2029 domain-containing protein [Anaerolineales bacterium]|nr:DUF2029 domain-containing protein [Anaerolineales bacterium]